MYSWVMCMNTWRNSQHLKCLSEPEKTHENNFLPSRRETKIELKKDKVVYYDDALPLR